MSATGRSYTQNFFKVQHIIIQAIVSRKSMKKFAVTYEKNIHVYKTVDRKNNSNVDMRTSHSQLLEKGYQHGEEDSKKNCHKKSTSAVKIFLFRLPAG